MLFQVKAVRDDAQVVSLPIEAFDAQDAERLTREQGYDVLAVKQASKLISPFGSGRGGFSVLLFTQELIALLEAGLNLVAALEALIEKESSSNVRQLLSRILERLYRGSTLSDALEEFPHIFSPLYIATVRSNERTGGLIEALTRYAKYQAQMDQVRSKLVSALIYPALLFVVGSGVTLLLLFYVVPKFRPIFEDLGTDLPLFSRLLVDWGRLVESHGLMLAGILAGLIIGAISVLTQPAVKRFITSKLLTLPAIGEHFRIYQYARFYRTLGMLQRSGIPLADALRIAGSLMTEVLRVEVVTAERAVRDGVAFSQAMESNQLTTPIAFRLLRVGEHSGNMPAMLDRIASFYEEQLARWVEWFSKLFEPLLMAAIGIVIGSIVIFLYMPIFELAGSIQ